jgi:hypothetical protein
MAPAIGTFDPAVRVDQPEGRSVGRKRRVLYGVTTALLSLLLGAAIVDGLGAADIYGVDSATTTATAGGTTLEVRHGTVSRPGLATPFDITVRRAGGFDAPVRIAVDSAYLAMWDENGLDPQPTAETQDESVVMWEFDPPESGETLVVSFDARIEPAVQRGASGHVALLDDDGSEVIRVRFSTRILP